MESTKFIQKCINNEVIYYNREIDVLYSNALNEGYPYNRTQVKREVDLCIEVTTFCNMSCYNCFAKSSKGRIGKYIDFNELISKIEGYSKNIIRVCITGGEPLLHPDVERILELPKIISNCGYVFTTNGSLKPEVDYLLQQNDWLVAVSLHGTEKKHNNYTASKSFSDVIKRINKLAQTNLVHIYTVLHDELTEEDILWLKKFRDQSGASFLRFITPRPYGRFRSLNNEKLIGIVEKNLDNRSGLKIQPSHTRFISVDGEERLSS